jgi:hypothetical protein
MVSGQRTIHADVFTAEPRTCRVRVRGQDRREGEKQQPLTWCARVEAAAGRRQRRQMGGQACVPMVQRCRQGSSSAASLHRIQDQVAVLQELGLQA